MEENCEARNKTIHIWTAIILFLLFWGGENLVAFRFMHISVLRSHSDGACSGVRCGVRDQTRVGSMQDKYLDTLVCDRRFKSLQWSNVNLFNILMSLHMTSSLYLYVA